MPPEKSGTGDEHDYEQERREREQERREREEVREIADEATNYLGDGEDPWAIEQGPGAPEDAPLVTSEVAVMYALVPAKKEKGKEEEGWWRDRRLGIGTCPYHSYPSGYPIEDNPCPYQAASVLVANTPDALYRAAWSEALIASPNLPRQVLWTSLRKNWRVERVEMTSVRIAWLGEESEFSGGEPRVRSDGRLRRGPSRPLSWERLRECVRTHRAAIAIIGSDPQGLNLAARAIVFKVPFNALAEADVIVSTPLEEGYRVKRLPRLRLGNRLLIAKLANWPPGRHRLRDAVHFRLTMWRANRRKTVKERRQRRQARRTARRDIIRRELALDEPDAAKRAGTRRELIGTLREAVGLMQNLAEGLVEVAKALRGFVLPAVLLPSGVGLALLLRLFLG
jgi:hypothetical protein